MEYIIKNRIDELISNAMMAFGTEKDETTKEAIRIELELYRAIKTEFKKMEGRTGKEITTKEEFDILLNMKIQREESWNIYKNAGRWDLANKENMEVEMLSRILPSLPTTEDIVEYIKEIIKERYNNKCVMRDIKDILAETKKKYPSADGGIVSSVVKQYV